MKICVACNAPLMSCEVVNTDASVRMVCSCGTRLRLVRGEVTLDRTFRHPDHITGSDEAQYQDLRRGLKDLRTEIRELTELQQAMSSRADFLWKSVQHTFVRRHEVKSATDVLGQKKAADLLSQVFTPEQLKAMMDALT